MIKIKYIVGIDVETTSLDPTTGDIIEVAAIRYDYNTGKEIDRFVYLTKPSSPISAEITAITGINQKMVDNAKPFSEYAHELINYIKDDIVFAHNASFDINYLSYHGAVITNSVWDTFILSSVAWPEATSYNLGMLAQYLNILVDGEHRAATDVETTHKLLNEIKKKLVFSKSCYHDIVSILNKASLQDYLPLFSAGNKTEHISEDKIKDSSSKTKDIDLKKIFSSNGVLDSKIKHYSYRPEQLKMSENVLEGMENSAITIIEAGTGLGKTYAYLVPALLSASQSKPSVISTHTKHLQDQLTKKDIPFLQETLNSRVKIATLKGRSNYICGYRLARQLAKPKIKLDMAFFLIKIVGWLSNGGDGDIQNLNLSHHGDKLISSLNADSLLCRYNCKQASGCPYRKAKTKAMSAELLVVNHALLINSLGDNTGLNLEANIIIDEAHHLEDVTRDAAALDFSIARISELLETVISEVKKNEPLRKKHLVDDCKALITEYREILLDILNFVQSKTDSNRLQLTKTVRGSSNWKKIEKKASAWRNKLKFVVGLSQSIIDQSPGNKDALKGSIKNAEQLNIELLNFFAGAPGRVQWAEIINTFNEKQYVQLKDVPLLVESMLSPIFSISKSVLLTSATLTTDSNFSYIKRSLGIEDSSEYIYESSFPYRDNVMVYLVENSPNPANGSYSTYVSKTIINLSKTITGRILGLFTSHQAVSDVYRDVIRGLSEADTKVFAQNITGGRTNMMTRFKDIANSLLLGTNSFWEGIDIAGESLSVVVIPKLPFPVPSDPIISSLAEELGADKFDQIILPRMLIKLKQGVGRLMRVENDKGVIIILDSRIHEQRYGDQVIKSLPPATIKIGPSSEIISSVINWFGEDQIASWKSEKGIIKTSNKNKK